MAEEIGVAGNNEEELNKSNLGALTPEVLQALGILPKTYQSALLAAEALTPKKREIDPAMASFLFFNNMARAASQPGATVLGSAAQSFEDPAKYLMQINEANRAAEQAKGPLAVKHSDKNKIVIKFFIYLYFLNINLYRSPFQAFCSLSTNFLNFSFIF